MRFWLAVALFAVMLSLNGCASAPSRAVSGYSPAIGEKASDTAVSMIGRHYKYKGDSPSGFDCSGLVRYSYLAAGMDVPHNTSALKNVTRSIGKSMRKGDLVFFNEKRGKYSHVGIYVGGDFFVHAPGTGQKVRKDSLRDPYWGKHFTDARRFI